MKKTSFFPIVFFVVILGAQSLCAGDSFKFPKRIEFKLLKNDRIIGSCRLFYEEKGKKEGTSVLKLKNFQGLGLTSQEWLLTYIFSKDSSLYADFIMKGKKPVSEIRLKQGTSFDGTKDGKFLIYKDLESPGSPDSSPETEIFSDHLIIDLLSMFYVTSQKVAAGKIGPEKFNFIIHKSAKDVDLVPLGLDKVPFQGKEVTSHVFSFTYHNQEIFRLGIYKDAYGYCFPVSILIVTDFTGSGQAIELRADKVSK
jgi:hypothetical protein